MMKRTVLASATAIATLATSGAVLAQDGPTIGVSWSNFQEERWKTDEAAIKEALDAAGATYISADAQASAAKQLTDIEALITQGADALIILAMDKDAIGPAIQAADDNGIPVVGYDRLIEDERAFYITFDNKGVGRIIAETVTEAQPEGNFAIIKGDPGDPNALFLLEGMMEVIGDDVEAGTINIACESFTDGWQPNNAQQNMEQCLTQTGNEIDAVLAENDGMAGGVIAALSDQGMEGLPVGGQDGDLAALNRVARGTQTVSVWKNSNELGKRAAEIAVSLAEGTAMSDVEGAEQWSGGEKGVEMSAIFLEPTPITQDNLNEVIDAGHISQEQACEGAEAGIAACEG